MAVGATGPFVPAGTNDSLADDPGEGSGQECHRPSTAINAGPGGVALSVSVEGKSLWHQAKAFEGVHPETGPREGKLSSLSWDGKPRHCPSLRLTTSQSPIGLFRFLSPTWFL